MNWFTACCTFAIVVLIALAVTANHFLYGNQSQLIDGVSYPKYFEDFPVPQLPNSVMTTGSLDSQGPAHDCVCLESNEDPESVFRFYENFLSKNHWQVTSVTKKAKPLSIRIEAKDPAAHLKYYFKISKVSKELDGFPDKRFGTTEIWVGQRGFVYEEMVD